MTHKVTKEDDVHFLSHPDDWPNWPVCPVKSHNPKHKGTDRSSFPACGLVFADISTVVMLNMFAGWSQEQYDKAQKFVYGSFEDLVADGWEVD